MAGALVGVGVGLGAFNDVRGGGLQGLGSEGAHVDGAGVDQAVAIAGLLRVGNGGIAGSGSCGRSAHASAGSGRRRDRGRIGRTGRNDGGHALRGRVALLLLLLGSEGRSLPAAGAA